jgi:hypothetical protein
MLPSNARAVAGDRRVRGSCDGAGIAWRATCSWKKEGWNAELSEEQLKMTSSPEGAVLVTTSSSTAGRHMCRRLKSSNGGEIVTLGGDVCCTRVREKHRM